MFAAALTQRTDRIRLRRRADAVFPLSPAAPQLALLDNLSKGRIDVGVGKGTVYNE